MVNLNVWHCLPVQARGVQIDLRFLTGWVGRVSGVFQGQTGQVFIMGVACGVFSGSNRF